MSSPSHCSGDSLIPLPQTADESVVDVDEDDDVVDVLVTVVVGLEHTAGAGQSMSL